MSFFPFFKEIEGARCLIAGGGRVALRKVQKLLPYGPEITVIAPEILHDFYHMDVTVLNRAFRDSDISPDTDFVIAACDDEAQNRHISSLCLNMSIPVNVVDAPELCTFLFPSLVKKGDLSVGISTSGASPSAAAWLRGEVERLLPDHMEEILEHLKEQRYAAKRQIASPEARSRYLKQLFTESMDKSEGFNENGAGCVSLVGAGCGSREWITLEGLRLLQGCDAVVYDDLIDKRLLDEAPDSAKKIYVGKRSHKPSAGQKDIEQILISLASQGKNVVRLKGGDPFVFGRGGEEIQGLNKSRIPWRSVPGISSALAIPAEAGIPVTHRGVSRSIHIMTAHTGESVLRRDLKQLAGLEGTLVFLMGLESLDSIVSALTEGGLDENTPAAVLSGGNAAHPYKVTGTLCDIVEKAAAGKVTTPGVIVIGDVVALDFHNDGSRALSSISVGLTGTEAFQDKLRKKLLPLGAEPVSMMRGSCVEIPCALPWDRIKDSAYKWIVFTSAQGVRAFFRRCKGCKLDHRSFAYCKFAVIGPATGEELEKHGFTADLCPDQYTSEALTDAMLSQLEEGEQVYLFCSRQGSSLLPERLRREEIECHRFDIYDIDFTCVNQQQAKPEYLMLGSAGGVRALYISGYRPEKTVTAICIGPVCGEAYRECFGETPIIAKTATAEAMIAALLNAAAGKEV